MVVNIFLMKENASEILSARKKIQQKVARPNVRSTWKNSFREGSILPCATMSRLFLLVFITIEGIMNRAFRNPQKNESPVCPMPKTTYQENDKGVTNSHPVTSSAPT